MKKPGQKGYDAAALDTTSQSCVTVPTSGTRVAADKSSAVEVDRVMDLMMATIEVQKEMGNEVGFHQMDVIYQHCKDYIARKSAATSSTTFMATSSTTKPASTRGGSRATSERAQSPPLRWAHLIMETEFTRAKLSQRSMRRRRPM